MALERVGKAEEAAATKMEKLSSAPLLPESFHGARDDIGGQITTIWWQIKTPLIVPLLRVAVFLCLAMSIMLVAEKVYMAAVIAFIKLRGRRPEKVYKWEPISDDLELGSSAYPMVLVQIPMFNEKEVRTSLNVKCNLPNAFLSICNNKSILSNLNCSGVPTLHRSFVRPVMAVGPDYNPSARRLDRSSDQGIDKFHPLSASPSVFLTISIKSMKVY